MKVQCPSCREIVDMQEFETSAEGLRFVCSACGASNFIANPSGPAAGTTGAPEQAVAGGVLSAAGPEALAPAAPARAGAAADEILCPKCGHAQSDPFACHRCGLVFERFDPSKLPPDPLEAARLWDQLEQRPGDEELHERFVHECTQLDRLDYATRQYRILARREGGREVAERMLARVAELGQARLPASVSSHEQTREQGKTLRLILWAVVLLGLGALAWAVFQSVGG